MKTCPVARCVHEIDDRHVMCVGHWEDVPAPLRKTLWLLWKEGTPRPGFEEALASALEQIPERRSVSVSVRRSRVPKVTYRR